MSSLLAKHAMHKLHLPFHTHWHTPACIYKCKMASKCQVVGSATSIIQSCCCSVQCSKCTAPCHNIPQAIDSLDFYDRRCGLGPAACCLCARFCLDPGLGLGICRWGRLRPGRCCCTGAHALHAVGARIRQHVAVAGWLGVRCLTLHRSKHRLDLLPHLQATVTPQHVMDQISMAHAGADWLTK